MDNETTETKIKNWIVNLSSIYLEITRRCNLNCKHCLRGDPRDNDMSKEQIDRILDCLGFCFNFFIGGGEPFLAKESVLYLLEQIKKRHLINLKDDDDKSSYYCAITHIGTITNGTIRDMDIINALNDISYFLLGKKEVDENGEPVKTVSIGISKDIYHDNNPEECMEWFKSVCSPHIELKYNELEIDDRTGQPKVTECYRAKENNIFYRKRYDISELHRVELVDHKMLEIGEEKTPVFDGDCMCCTCTNLFVKSGFYDYRELENPDYPFILGNYMEDSLMSMIVKWNTLHPLLERQSQVYEELIKRAMTQKEKEKVKQKFFEKEEEVRRQQKESPDKNLWDIYYDVLHWDLRYISS